MRTVIGLLFLLCSSDLVYGQFMLGGKVGVHGNTIRYERASLREQYKADYKAGFNIGGGITFPVTELFSMHTEVLYAYKGKAVRVPLESFKNTGNYHYLEMPIMMRYLALPQQKVYLAIGPNLSYWIAGTGKITNLTETVAPDRYKVQFEDNSSPDDLFIAHPQRLQLALIAGIGTILAAQGDNRIIIEARYEMGHSFLGSKEGGVIQSSGVFDNLQSKYQLISLNVGYYWAFHKKSNKRSSHTYKAKNRK